MKIWRLHLASAWKHAKLNQSLSIEGAVALQGPWICPLSYHFGQTVVNATKVVPREGRNHSSGVWEGLISEVALELDFEMGRTWTVMEVGMDVPTRGTIQAKAAGHTRFRG